MKRVLLASLPIWLSGCMHTHIGSGPVVSPDQHHKVYVTAHGQSARSYIDQTEKKVAVSIVKEPREHNATPFETWAVLEAGDLSWTSTWLDSNSVRVEFFESKGDQPKQDRGFVLIKGTGNPNIFSVAEHSGNVKIRKRIYFF